jgi:hypothetical protein
MTIKETFTYNNKEYFNYPGENEITVTTAFEYGEFSLLDVLDYFDIAYDIETAYDVDYTLTQEYIK